MSDLVKHKKKTRKTCENHLLSLERRNYTTVEKNHKHKVNNNYK